MASCLRSSWNHRVQTAVLKVLCFGALIFELMDQREVAAWTYNYSTSAYSWNFSRNFCQKYFTDLVAIQNKNEIAYLNDVIPYYSSYYWIGIRKIDNNWTWVGTKRPLAKEAENWADNEPNNKKNDQDCVEIYIKSPSAPGKWNDEPCRRRKRALCYTASCRDTSCGEQGECVETIGNYTCSCSQGFYGPECEHVRECGEPERPRHALMSCHHPLGNFSFKSQCGFRCAPGYTLQGPRKLECSASGAWTDRPPRCEATQCPPLRAPERGSMTCPHAAGAAPHRPSCRFSCDEGSTLVGPEVVRCTASGEWTASAPVCRAVECPPLGSPAHGSADCSPSSGAFGYNASCSFRCAEGFVLRGADTVRCAGTGQWTAPAPVCQAVACTPLLSPRNGAMTCVQPPGDSGLKSTCQFTCNAGFSLSGPDRLDCTPSGHWTGSPPVCEAIKCPELLAPEWGSLDCSDPRGELGVGSTCHFSCHKGFRLEGSSDVKCAASGRWTAPPPTCEGAASPPAAEGRCLALLTPAQGTMTCRHHRVPFGWNTTCYFVCNAGFSLEGDSALGCGLSGQWTAAVPACRAVKCSELRVTEPTLMNCSDPWGNFSYGSACTFQCPAGQLLNGSAKTACQENGQWLTTMPTCQAGPLTVQEALTYFGGAVASVTGLAMGWTLLALLRKRCRRKDDGESPLNPQSHLGTYGVFTNAAFDPSP